MFPVSSTWIFHRALELSYSAWDLEPFAQESGYEGPPFICDEERRFLIRCELDATFFHLYLGHGEWNKSDNETDEQLAELKKYFPTPHHAVEYIMDTFPIVKRRDEEVYGSFRTKATILEIYDALTESIRTGKPYQTRINPPPGPPCDMEGHFIPMEQWDSNNWPSHIHRPRPTAEPLVEIIFPNEPRIPLEAPGAYMQVFLLQLLRQAKTYVPLVQVADAYLAVAYPDFIKSKLNNKLKNSYGKWRERFNEGDSRNCFYPALKALVDKGQVHLKRDNSGIVAYIDNEWINDGNKPDPWIDSDARFCLGLAKDLAKTASLFEAVERTQDHISSQNVTAFHPDERKQLLEEIENIKSLQVA